jgi:hypothetical protein
VGVCCWHSLEGLKINRDIQYLGLDAYCTSIGRVTSSASALLNSWSEQYGTEQKGGATARKPKSREQRRRGTVRNRKAGKRHGIQGQGNGTEQDSTDRQTIWDILIGASQRSKRARKKRRGVLRTNTYTQYIIHKQKHHGRLSAFTRPNRDQYTNLDPTEKTYQTKQNNKVMNCNSCLSRPKTMHLHRCSIHHTAQNYVHKVIEIGVYSYIPCGSVVVDALCYKPEGRGFVSRWSHWIIFSIYLILPAALGLGVYLASNRSEYQKQKKKIVWEVERGWRVGLTVNRLSRQCGILNISQPYRPPQPVTGIAVLYLLFTYSNIPCNLKRSI